MIYIHSFSNQEENVNAAENKQFSLTMENQDTCYKYVLCHILLMNHLLIVHIPDEYLKLDNLIMPKTFLHLVPLLIW